MSLDLLEKIYNSSLLLVFAVIHMYIVTIISIC